MNVLHNEFSQFDIVFMGIVFLHRMIGVDCYFDLYVCALMNRLFSLRSAHDTYTSYPNLVLRMNFNGHLRPGLSTLAQDDVFLSLLYTRGSIDFMMISNVFFFLHHEFIVFTFPIINFICHGPLRSHELLI